MLGTDNPFYCCLRITGIYFMVSLSLIIKEKSASSLILIYKKWLVTILVVLVIQLIYGAFMAGLKAAVTAPTWPDINGNFSLNNK